KATQVADHVAENEAKTAAELAGKDAVKAGEGGLHDPHLGGEGGGGEPALGAHGGPGQPSEGTGGCTTGGDPVDVVSGQMITAATDVELPGLLPLVLRRAYASGYRGGQLFGPGWSSTLDQRVEITPGGVAYAGDDAQILHYARPTAPGQSVLPADGARWPLTWDRESDVITITDPETGWARHFAPGSAQ